MKILKIIFAVALGLSLYGRPGFLLAEDDPVTRLASDLAKQLEPFDGKKIAVLSIPHHEKLLSEESKLLAERLSTQLATHQHLSILDRQHVLDVLSEQHLSQTGLMDQKSSQSIGNALGAEILITGTLIDLDQDQLEINIRGFLTSTGRVVAAGRTLIPNGNRRTDPLRRLAELLVNSKEAKKTPPVAVLEFTYPRGRVSTGSFLVAERLLTYLVQAGQPVIERRFLQKLLEEKHLSETGLMKPSVSAEMGKVLSADALVLGTLQDISAQSTVVMARAIETDTLKVLSAATVTIPRLWSDAPRLPRFLQSCTPVPILVLAVPNETDSNEGEATHSLDELVGTKKTSRYYPAPVPYFSSSMVAGGM